MKSLEHYCAVARPYFGYALLICAGAAAMGYFAIDQIGESPRIDTTDTESLRNIKLVTTAAAGVGLISLLGLVFTEGAVLTKVAKK